MRGFLLSRVLFIDKESFVDHVHVLVSPFTFSFLPPLFTPPPTETRLRSET